MIQWDMSECVVIQWDVFECLMIQWDMSECLMIQWDMSECLMIQWDMSECLMIQWDMSECPALSLGESRSQGPAAHGGCRGLGVKAFKQYHTHGFEPRVGNGTSPSSSPRPAAANHPVGPPSRPVHGIHGQTGRHDSVGETSPEDNEGS